MKKLFLLAFLPVFGLLLSKNCFAIRHDYEGLYTGPIFHPDIVYNSDADGYIYDFSQYDPYDISNSFSSPMSASIAWKFPSDYNFLDTRPFNSVEYSLSTLNTISLDGSNCNVNPNSNAYTIWRNLRLNSSLKTVNYSTRAYTFANWRSVNPCYRFPDFTSNYNFNYVSGATYHIKDWNSDYDLNYAVSGINRLGTSDGLSLTKTEVNDGFRVSSMFTPSSLVENNNMLGFSTLSIPLSSADGYFLDYSNLSAGTQLEWHFSFSIRTPVSIREGSSFRIEFPNSYYRVRPSSSSNTSFYRTCTYSTSDDTLDGFENGVNAVLIDVVCPVTLEADFAGLYPSLVFYRSDGASFFEEYNPYAWYWHSFYLITDNNYESSIPFNDQFTDSDWSPFNGQQVGDVSYFDSLKNLFTFQLPIGSTPIGMILGGFSDSNSCANIPTLAGMLHSNETQVCPFFPQSVRTVLTPVLGLFSTCLVFGAFMSWLGGSSGNFIEDSSSHSWGGFKIAKGGKK